MIIFIKPDGTGKGRAEIVTPEVIYQGSNNVTNIVVMAPYAPQTSMEIGFILPDGLYWNAPAVSGKSGGRYAPMSFVEQNMTNKVGVWEYALPASVTSMFGKVQIAINAITRINTGGTTTVEKSNCTSYLCEFTVQESVVPDLPANPPDDVYTLLRQYLSALDGRTANVPNLVASIQKSDGNSFTFTDNKGLTSEPITLGEIDYNPTYIGAASVIDIPITAWQPNSTSDPTGYTVTITAAIHGQMHDGVTANDLWISFDKTDNNVIGSAYQGYTVSSSGDITLNVTTPVKMTVRVWNGKGLVDTTARGDIAAETARAEAEEARLQSEIDVEQTRAETAESHLQDQIYELQNTGVDLTARAQIEAETARAEAAESQLQNNINAETTRAETAESELSNQIAENTSDIEGLRQDITNESHFRGMFNSIEDLRAAYPTATPNDYAYIVGGNQWLYQNGAWTDSEIPSPNTSVPKGTSIPLMDGSGSAGTSSSYASEDHRHPSDTNKLNKNGDTAEGKINFAGGAAFPSSAAIAEKDELPYFLGMTAFTDGGNICWARVDNTKEWLGINEKVSKSGDRITGPLTVKPTSGRALLEVISEQNVPCDIYMGANDKRMFSWTARAENNAENLRFGLYDAVKVKYAIKLTDDDKFHFYYPIYDGESRVYSADNPPPAANSRSRGTLYGNTDATNTTLGYGTSIFTAGGSGAITHSVAIGNDAKVYISSPSSTVYTNSMALGYGASVLATSNAIQMGNSSISSFKCKVSVTTTSDERDKGDIVDIDTDLALRFVTQVEPIHYVDNDRYKYLKLKKKIDPETGEETYDDSDENTKLYLQYGMCEYDRESHARGDKKGRRGRIGVKAQQVQQALLDIFGSDNYANLVNDDYYDLREEGNEPPVENHLSVSYERFVPFLIAAIQAQQKQIDELKELVKGKV